MANPSSAVKEETLAFKHPSLDKPSETWYKVVGDLENSTGTPCVAIHGGPGMSHNYLLSLSRLAEPPYNIPIIFYDQIGCGLSTHFPEKSGEESFWTVELFMAELDNLLDKLGIADRFDLLGSSWGGQIAASFAIRGHKGLRRLVLYSSPASMAAWRDSYTSLRKTLPQELDERIEKVYDKPFHESPEYQAAYMEFTGRFMCRLNPPPQDLLDTFGWLMKDITVSLTMYGTGPLHAFGSLRDFDLTGQCHKIMVPTLLLNGEFDEADDNCLYPFFNEVPKIKWYKFDGASHMAHLETPEKFMKVVPEFLLSKAF